MFQTIQNDAVAEVTEKKSRFIAHAFYVESVDEAEKRIEEIRKKYRDARHNCYAYRVIEQDQIIPKSSDDGEPSGTAGAPMLSILEKNNLSNVVVIVCVMYFFIFMFHFLKVQVRLTVQKLHHQIIQHRFQFFRQVFLILFQLSSFRSILFAFQQLQ